MKTRLLIHAAVILSALSLQPSAFSQAPKPITIDLDRVVIVIPDGKRNDVVKYATDELQQHIKLVSGIEAPVVKKAEKGKFPIHVGIQPTTDTKPLAPEEARLMFTENKGIYLYGKDKIGGKKGSIKTYKDAALNSDTEAGTLFAVYEFIERCLGVRWIEPGPKGTAFTPSKTFTFIPVTGNYIPKLQQRHMRSSTKDDLRARALAEQIPEKLQFTDAEFAQRNDEEQTWRRRMRMGSPTLTFTYGHAFTKWWDKYGATHPEYFALAKNGKRGTPGSRGDRVKMCVSNPDLARQVAADHFAANPGKLVVNATENDSRGFCTCEKCKALDVVLPGEENIDIDDRHVTDRYVYFFNAVLREARKINPAAQVVCYAYSRYNEPPRREKLDPGIIIFLLPNLGDTASFEKYCADWKTAGARIVFMRPNDLNQDTGLPHGFEEKMFGKLKTAARQFDLIGTDYDICYGFWPISGIANYILARGFYRPDRSFEDWHREYCATFGEAAPDMSAYYTHWRGIWNNRIMPNIDKINQLTGTYKLLRSKLTHLTDLLYEEADFDKTDAILATALTRKNLTPWAKEKIATMQLANQHSRLKYRALCANRMAANATPEQQKQTAQALYDFRLKHRPDLNIHWELMMYLENAYEDNAGTTRLFGTETDRRRNWRIQETEKFRAARGDYKTPLR